jgi:hypothetical protein
VAAGPTAAIGVRGITVRTEDKHGVWRVQLWDCGKRGFIRFRFSRKSRCVTLSIGAGFRPVKIGLTVAAISALAMASGACSSAEHAQAPSSSHASTSSASATSQSHAASAVPQTARLPNGSRSVGPGTIFSQCGGGFADGDDVKFDTSGEVFNPRTGQNVPIPVPTIPSGQKLVSYACTVGGDQDNIRVFYLVRFLTPSNGLTPESTTTSIVAFDPFSSGAPQSVPWSENGRTYAVFPTYYGFVTKSDKGLTGFDGKALQSTFASPSTSGDMTFSGFYVKRSDGSVGFHSLKDGAEVGSTPVDVGSGIVTFGDGILVQGQRGFKYFDFKYNKLIEHTGVGSVSPHFGVWNNTLLYWESADHEAASIEVRDIAENKVLFSRSASDLAGLGIGNILFAGKYLYMVNRSDSPVIDISNSQKVSSGWKVRPLQLIGRDWMGVVKDLDFDNQLTAGGVCAGLGTPTQGPDICARGFSLVYAPNGKYPGPWF